MKYIPIWEYVKQKINALSGRRRWRLSCPRTFSVQRRLECTRNKPAPYSENRPHTTTSVPAHLRLAPAVRKRGGEPVWEMHLARTNSLASREWFPVPQLCPD